MDVVGPNVQTKEITSDIAILSRPAIWHGPILSCRHSRVPPGVLKIIL